MPTWGPDRGYGSRAGSVSSSPLVVHYALHASALGREGDSSLWKVGRPPRIRRPSHTPVSLCNGLQRIPAITRCGGAATPLCFVILLGIRAPFGSVLLSVPQARAQEPALYWLLTTPLLKGPSQTPIGKAPSATTRYRASGARCHPMGRAFEFFERREGMSGREKASCVGQGLCRGSTGQRLSGMRPTCVPAPIHTQVHHKRTLGAGLEKTVGECCARGAEGGETG